MVMALALLASGAACRTGINYAGAFGPRYVGGVDVLRPVARVRGPDSLRLVTFNVQFARHIDRAIDLLISAPELQQADIIALQEMDAFGASRIANALGMRYVYYPATVHPKTGRDFGNAILSRWPIVADRKVILPHLARFEKTARIATGATIDVGGALVRVYSVHLGTFFGNGPRARRDQADAVLADAADYPLVVIAGDMNSHGIGKEFRAYGYRWPTEHNPATDHFFRFDHVFLKGFERARDPGTGVVSDNRGASDHRPVWVALELRDPFSNVRPAATGP
jgi:endonuclease/exonuclease/phosphatase family metal-dependent hydrolase